MTAPTVSLGKTGTCLLASTVILLEERRIALFGPSTRISIDLEFQPAVPVPPRSPLEISALTALLQVDDAVILSDLSIQLDRAGLIEPTNRQAAIGDAFDHGTTAVVTMGELLARAKAGRDLTRLLAITAGSALWTGEDPALAATALGIFVARMPNRAHRAAYGAALTEPATMVWGDLPSRDDLQWALGVLDPGGPPVTFDLRARHESGRLPHQGAAFKAAAGELAVAAQLNTTVIGTGAGTVTLVSAVAADPPGVRDPFLDRPLPATYVGAADTDPDLAVTKCMSEAAEFLISNTPAPGAVHSAATDLNAPWLSPDDVVSYQHAHRDRLAVSAFDPREPQWWVPGTRAGDSIWLPAPLVLGRAPSRPSWFHPSATSSSGVAAHPVLAQAIRSAWLEAVERDAFQRCRLLAGNAPPATVRMSSIPAAEQPILRTLTRWADVRVLALESPTGCPVLMVRTDTRDRLGLGCAAAHHPLDALHHALIEAVSQALSPVPEISSAEQVRTPLDHAGFYLSPARRSRLDWMFSGPVVDFDELQTAQTTDLPDGASVHVFTHPVPLDIHVVRVIDADLIPITFGHDTDPDGRADFRELAERGGHDPGSPIEPHPLA